MHPRQAKLIKEASELAASIEDKTATPPLWQYFTEDGKPFWLTERLLSVRDPFTGKRFPTKPMRQNPGGLMKTLKEVGGDPEPEEISIAVASTEDPWKI